tara:strand:- start:28 stop:954 length:927 start_codon:yes stop_codon:yes gene_type:complete
MGFKLPGKSMTSGTSAHSSALKMRAEQNAASALKQVEKKMAEADWKKGQKSAKGTGRDLDALVKKRGGLKKGSDEYNVVQNQINKALGSKKRHGVTTVATDTKGKKTSNVKTTPGISDLKVTEKTRKSGEVKKRVTEADREEGYGDKKVVEKFRKGGERKSSKIIEEGLTTKRGTSDKTTKKKYTKEGTVKKTKVKYKTDTDGQKGSEIKGKVKRKYDAEGNVIKTKKVERESGRRTVTKTDKEGNVTTSSRRTLKGFLTGKGKKKDDSPAKKPSDLEVGNRKNLPEHLKAKISAAKMYNTPAKKYKK